MKDLQLKIAATHLTGATAFACISVAVTLAWTPDAWQMLFDEQLGSSTRYALAGQALFGVLMWPLTCVVVGLVNRFRARGRDVVVHRLARARGTAMLETIIVMPVMLMMIFGLCQFAINNIAAVMINYATYSAARAAWVWEGESENETGLEEAGERARIAVATAMTPVTPGLSLESRAGTEQFAKARGILVAAQSPAPHAGMGEEGVSLGAEFARGGIRKPPSLAEILGVTSFQARSGIQMTNAYRATVIELEYVGNEIQTKVNFQHPIIMPLVGPIFGTKTTVAGHTGYWMLFERSYNLRRMMRAHRDTTGLIGPDKVPEMF